MHANGELLADSEYQSLLTSRLFPPSAPVGFCMSFHYHMYGSNVGQLSVIGLPDDGAQTVVGVLEFLFTDVNIQNQNPIRYNFLI